MCSRNNLALPFVRNVPLNQTHRTSAECLISCFLHNIQHHIIADRNFSSYITGCDQIFLLNLIVILNCTVCCAFCHFLFLKGRPPMSEIDFSRQLNDWIRREHLSVRPVKRVNGCGSRGYQGIRVLPEYQARPHQVC